MKRIVLLIFGVVLLFGCSGTKETQKVPSSTEKMKLGWIRRDDLMKPDYPKFKENYDTIHVDEQFVQMITMLHNGIDVVVVLGTWCGDSKREVPRFLKLVDLTSIPAAQIQFYGVDRTKKSSDGVTEKYKIELVPTFIFFKKGEEVGRIIETPKNSLEEDMLAILADAQSK